MIRPNRRDKRLRRLRLWSEKLDKEEKAKLDSGISGLERKITDIRSDIQENIKLNSKYRDDMRKSNEILANLDTKLLEILRKRDDEIDEIRQKYKEIVASQHNLILTERARKAEICDCVYSAYNRKLNEIERVKESMTSCYILAHRKNIPCPRGGACWYKFFCDYKHTAKHKKPWNIGLCSADDARYRLNSGLLAETVNKIYGILGIPDLEKIIAGYVY